jgi:CcmD family protein
MPLVLLQTELPFAPLPYLYAAFAVSWAGFFVYAFFVSRRQQEIQKEIRALRQALEQQDSSSGA